MSESELRTRLDVFADDMGHQWFRHCQGEITGIEMITWLLESCEMALTIPLRPEDV